MASKEPRAVSFSDQLRAAVRDCGTSRYSLAKQIGVSESTLSRFVSGERGLPLGVIDKLTDVLGLRIVATVQRVIRPKRRSPKPQLPEKPMKTKRKKDPSLALLTDWKKVAKFEAKDANENNFSSRRGIHGYDFADVLCIYNNNPYANYPELRDEETALFREWLKLNQIPELAFATYPTKGEDAGYTTAMLIGVGEDRMDEVTAEVRRILEVSSERMKPTAK